MKTYSFLSEATSKVWRKILSLPDEEAQSLAKEWILKKTKSTDLATAADRYAERLYKGNRTKISNLAKKYGRKHQVIDVPSGNGFSGPWKNGTDIIGLPKFDAEPVRTLGWQVNPTMGITHRDVKKMTRELNRSNLHRGLDNALKGAHEADEYESLLKYAKQQGISPELFSSLIAKRNRYLAGRHFPGVLDKEQQRFRVLGKIFDRGTFQVTPRTKREVKLNKVKHK